jgi:diacylglycerol kinase (ATP)
MKHNNVFESLATAFAGLMFAVRHQKNIKYLLSIAVAVVAAAPFLKLSAGEAMALSLTISLVIITELLNAGVEYAIDLVTDDYHHLAKAAKDVAAAAVLVACLNAVVVAAVFLFSRLG